MRWVPSGQLYASDNGTFACRLDMTAVDNREFQMA
jgi:hypothetical protein